MDLLKRTKVDTKIESTLVYGLIQNTQLLTALIPSIDINYFENQHNQKIVEWILEHYEYYEEAPGIHINDILLRKSKTLDDDEESLIKKIISKGLKTSSSNVDYATDEALQFFKKRELEITADNIKYYLGRNEIAEAERELEEYRKVSKITSDWVNPFDEAEVEDFYAQKEQDFIKFPGELGELLGGFERHWLVGLSGAFKVGKTWLLQDFAILALANRLKVVFFSLEMQKNQMKGRIYQRLLTLGKEGGKFLYPVFDCLANQNGTCERNERTNTYKLVDNHGAKPSKYRLSNYRPCTYCRDNHISDYSRETWFTEIEEKGFDGERINSTIRAMNKQFGGLFRLKTYPRFSANVGDIMRDLDILEWQEGFVPDIVLVDYADILKPEDSRKVGVEKEDETWMKLAQLAGDRHCLVVTPTQINKEGQDVVKQKRSHQARWIGKLAHVDSMLTIDQTPSENRAGIVRIGVQAHRHREFDEEKTCVVLQQLSTGQVNLDSQR